MNISESLLNGCLDKIIKNKYVFNTVFRVESGDGSFSFTGSRGEIKTDSKYFIASVTKLYVTAIIMSLIEENRLNLDDKISKYLPAHFMENLHVHKGTDYSNEITVRHLISNTSGLPDYFFHKEGNKSTTADSLSQGNDESWKIERTLKYVKQMPPHFPPGKKGKAKYSDTNYQLLGSIMETVTEKDIAEVFNDYIFSKLGLTNTYMYNDASDNKPVAFYYKEKCLWLPKYMAGIGSEGGIVSTAEEVMIFLKAFFDGFFFQKDKIEGLKKWNFLLPPPGSFYYGIGLEKWFTPRILSPIKPINEILGFWGQTSAFAWYNPDTDLYFSGTANQMYMAGHNAVSNAITKIIKSAL